MLRFRLQNGMLLPPPRDGVSAEGKAVSGFGRRVAEDATFAAANGYYPLAQQEEPVLVDGVQYGECYTLEGDRWVCHTYPLTDLPE
jgi:hypothetical protein